LTFVCGPRNRLNVPRNGEAFSRSKYAPENNSNILKNRLDALRNPRIIFRSIFTPKKGRTVLRNAEPVLKNIY
jgi:hypothetical protein